MGRDTTRNYARPECLRKGGKGGVGVLLGPGRSGSRIQLLTAEALAKEKETRLAAFELYSRSGRADSAIIVYVLHGDVRSPQRQGELLQAAAK